MTRSTLPQRQRISTAVLAIYATLAWTFAAIYDRTDARIYATPSLADLVHFVGRKPMQLRFLAPLVERGMIAVTGISIDSANKIVAAVAVFFILYYFRRLLGRFVPTASATWLALAILYPMLWNYCLLVYGDFPSDLPAIAFFLALLDLLLDRRWLFAYAMFAIACMNRESILFAVPAFALFEYDRDGRRLLAPVAVLLVIWVAAHFLIQSYFADLPGNTTEWQLPYNLQFVRDALHGDRSILRLAFFAFGGMHLVSLIMLRRAPNPIKRLYLLVPLIAGVMLAYGLYNEVRIFSEMIPVVAIAVLVPVYERLRHSEVPA